MQDQESGQAGKEHSSGEGDESLVSQEQGFKPTEASARPWKQSCFLVTSAKGDWVAHTGMGNLPPSRSHESEANAELIVRAVNAHDALVAACRVAADTLRDAGRTYNGDENWFTARRTCEAALALATKPDTSEHMGASPKR